MPLPATLCGEQEPVEILILSSLCKVSQDRCSYRLSEESSETKCSTGHDAAAAAKLLQSCPTLCDPIDGSPPGSPVPGILQARTLEWVAIAFSEGIFNPL